MQILELICITRSKTWLSITYLEKGDIQREILIRCINNRRYSINFCFDEDFVFSY